MANNYMKLSNQGNIHQNLMLLKAMEESTGYADANGYFTKRAVAEIGVNATIITSGGRFGEDILGIVNDTEMNETDNSILQNAKQRMQLLRCLGLVSTDYNSELYAITDLGHKVLEQSFPASASVAPSFGLLLESFMGLSTETEVYEYNCELGFNSYLGYGICYALACLDYRLAVHELPLSTTYDIDDIDEYIDLIRYYRGLGVKIPEKNEHFPMTNRGEPLKNPTNITRAITQVLRQCGIIELDTVAKDGFNYYVCTKSGEAYVEDVAKLLKNQRFWTAREFRKLKIVGQKDIAHAGYSNMLRRGGFDVGYTDERIVFSPYQLLPECWADWLFGKEPRKPPVEEGERIKHIESLYTVDAVRLKPRYFTEAEYSEFIRKHATADGLVHEVMNARDTGGTKEGIVEELLLRHKLSSKERFYPFVHALFRAIGLECLGEVGRIDCLLRFDGRDVPCEIKSFTETPTFNTKGARQAVENWIYTYRDEVDMQYASLLVGFDQPSSTIEIDDLIDAAFKTWGIKVIAMDLRTLVTMFVRSVWDECKIDLKELLCQHGIIEER